ncbi:MAG: hypothetical protein LBU65_06510 [Planctomycetaceae bacterium]|jgi:hypothetical protein|nr:hypothetical protein [Planctomycetaceae bacterium]
MMESNERITWHTAFQQAIQAEFIDYRDVLEFIVEFKLTTEPQSIDTLIIKKVVTSVVIEKLIAEIFRTYNVVEYKAPGTTAALWDYYKVQGYARQYASISRVRLTDVSVTLAVSHYPRELFSQLQDDFEIVETGKGVFYVVGEFVPTQIVVVNNLDEKESIWLRNLRSNITCDEMRDLLVDKIPTYHKIMPLDAFAHFVSIANFKILMELRKIMGKELDDFIAECYWYEEAIAKGKAEGIAEGEARGEAKLVLSALKFRFNVIPQDIENAVMSYTDTTAIESLLQCAIVCDSIDEFRKSLVF